VAAVNRLADAVDAELERVSSRAGEQWDAADVADAVLAEHRPDGSVVAAVDPDYLRDHTGVQESLASASDSADW
jgi:hypothetical protein